MAASRIPLLQDLAKDYGFEVKLYPVAGRQMQNQSSHLALGAP